MHTNWATEHKKLCSLGGEKVVTITPERYCCEQKSSCIKTAHRERHASKNKRLRHSSNCSHMIPSFALKRLYIYINWRTERSQLNVGGDAKRFVVDELSRALLCRGDFRLNVRVVWYACVCVIFSHFVLAPPHHWCTAFIRVWRDKSFNAYESRHARLFVKQHEAEKCLFASLTWLFLGNGLFAQLGYMRSIELRVIYQSSWELNNYVNSWVDALFIIRF